METYFFRSIALGQSGWVIQQAAEITVGRSIFQKKWTHKRSFWSAKTSKNHRSNKEGRVNSTQKYLQLIQLIKSIFHTQKLKIELDKIYVEAN